MPALASPASSLDAARCESDQPEDFAEPCFGAFSDPSPEAITIGSVNFRLKFNGCFLPFALLATISANSRADEADALNFFVGQGVTIDSNLF